MNILHYNQPNLVLVLLLQYFKASVKTTKANEKCINLWREITNLSDCYKSSVIISRSRGLQSLELWGLTRQPAPQSMCPQIQNECSPKSLLPATWPNFWAASLFMPNHVQTFMLQPAIICLQINIIKTIFILVLLTINVLYFKYITLG